MKNILFVISSLQAGGGAEKVCSTIGTKLNKNGYNVHFLTFYDYPKEKLYSFEGKYFSLDEKISKNFLINIFKLFKRASKIKKYCKKNNIETSISFMEEANFSNILSKIIFGNKSKIFVSIRQSANAWGKLYQFLIKKLYNFSDKIITIVNEEKQNLIKNHGIKKEKIEVIYNPIDLKKIHKLSQENLGEYKKLFNNGKFSFINIGRLTFAKNQELLINSFNEFNKKYSNTQLIIIGEGELRKNLENQIKDLNLKNKVYLLGLQKNPYKFLVNSNYFVFGSRWEGFPNVLLEALACGLPIISSDCSTGPAEILRKNGDFSKVNGVSVEDYGILYPEGNEEELLKAMEMIYLNENLRNFLQKKSLERARDFEVSKIIEKWKEII